MKLTTLYHAGNPNLCRIPELTIRSMPECEGGGWYLPKDQAEALVQLSERAKQLDDLIKLAAEMWSHPRTRHLYTVESIASHIKTLGTPAA